MASFFLERIKPNAVNDTLAQANWAEKKWVWVRDKAEGYLAGNIVEEKGDQVVIQMEDNSKRAVDKNDTEKMNPPKFDLVEDMAELTHLNEASVVHNLKLRYLSNLIYTYSGLFCVAVNPYKKLPIYSDDVIKAYKGKKRSEMPPHVYCIVDQAYNDMLNNRENQSILITGESGAGKTENTKKVIQYLAASSNSGSQGNLEKQIIQANPVLEAFGNAQTVRNNNSSRFGKFIRLEFNSSGQIAGANIDRYLLEKSRVTHQTKSERNYHIFYQLLAGASPAIKEALLLEGGATNYRFTKNSNQFIDGVDDKVEFKSLCDSLNILQFSESEQLELFRVISAILHLGNITLEHDREEFASIAPQAGPVIEKVCHVLGIPVAEFSRSLVRPMIKAGRDWVTQSRTVEQVYYSIEALARSIYERMFGDIVDKLNKRLYTSAQKQSFIGVLDIAGFEIFELNSFEQLCINYTNERLQQFFNHHMFILEQEEYQREGIEWKFIDFGLDLQPTIDLIEKTKPVGILSLLDEECVMPKATDKTFIDKLNGIWKGNSPKYSTPRFNAGFILTHYAGQVEYNVNGWLDKNKDPLNENITKLLANSSHKYIAELFEDSLGEDAPNAGKNVGITKKGAFRTVAQKHRESLTSLMNQLYSTHPHFVRCIIPNEEKRAGKIDILLVLDQLRCNGVLEGIRICRAGFPNRLIFQDFRTRYEVLGVGVIPKGYIDGRKAATLLLEHLDIDKNQYRVGSSKIFFKAGLLAELENLRDIQLGKIVIRIQAMMRGYLGRARYRREIEQFRAIKIIQRNARIYVLLREWSWWKLYSKVKPLLNVSRTDEEMKKMEALAKEWEEKAKKESEEKSRIESMRLALEMEKKQIEDFLLKEKNAAADQQEILSRTQKREVELNERLTEIIKDIEERDAQNGELRKARKNLESELESLREKIAADNLSLDKLEKEKISKDQRLKQITDELLNEQQRVLKLEADKKAAEAKIIAFEDQLTHAGASKSEIIQQKTKLQEVLLETEQKLDLELNQRKKLETRKSELEYELTQAHNTIDELKRVNSDLELSIKKKENEIQNMNQKLSEITAEKEVLERQSREQALKLEALADDLQNERNEKEKALKMKQRSEEEVEEIRALMTKKGNEESKQSELRRMRDQEVAELKTQLSALEENLDDTRKKGHLAAEKINAELDTVRENLAKMSKAKETAEEHLKELQESLEKSEDLKTKIERSKKQLDSDIDNLKYKLSETENQLFEVKSQKELLEKQMTGLAAKVEDTENRCATLEREKASAVRNASSISEELEQEVQKRQNLESQKKRLSMDLQDIAGRFSEEEAAKNDALSRLQQRTSELDQLREKYTKDVSERTAELEESKKKIERDLAAITVKLDERDCEVQNLERTKGRLSTEIEDLKLEIEREHGAAVKAERLLKQVESQLNGANLSIENERRQLELNQAECRKLQNVIDGLNLAMEEKNLQMNSLQKSKNDLDAELKALINEIGDGGKNLHELERAKRKLESEIDELKLQIEVESGEKIAALESKKSLDNQFSDYRKKTELDLASKDAMLEDTRKMLMKEVNTLGEQLDDALNAKNEAIKAKKRLEEQVESLSSQAENSAKGQSDLQKLKGKNEAILKELNARLEEERTASSNLQELCQRHEKKANSLQSEIERLELQIDNSDRTRKQMEKQIEELEKELNTGEDSKVNLLEVKRRLTTENQSLKKQIEEIEDELNAAKAAAANAKESTNRGGSIIEYEEKITAMEESRRALMAAQRIAKQEVEDKKNELAASEKAKRNLQVEIENLKAQLDKEILSKGEENAARRKLAAEQRELELKYEVQCAKASELEDALSLYRQKAENTAEKLEHAELGREKAEKNESSLNQQLKEYKEALNIANSERDSAQDQVRSLEDRLVDLQDKMEENSHELADLAIAKKRLQEELSAINESHRSEIAERESIEENQRKKFQKEMKEMIEDLQNEKSANITLKESVRDLENEVQSLNIKVETELRGATIWKREKDSLEGKLEDIQKALSTSVGAEQAHQATNSKLFAEIRELKAQLEEKDAIIKQQEKSRVAYEHRVATLDAEFNNSMKERANLNKSVQELGHHADELKGRLEDKSKEHEMAEQHAKRLEQHAMEIQQELSKERGLNIELEKAKHVLEKALKELNSRLYDMEAMQLSRDTNTTRRLESRIDELSLQLEISQKEKTELQKNSRKFERSVRELQLQLTDKDRLKARYEDEQMKLEQKLKSMKAQIDELEASESDLQLQKRKAEREAAEYREKALRSEKDLERLRARPLISNV